MLSSAGSTSISSNDTFTLSSIESGKPIDTDSETLSPSDSEPGIENEKDDDSRTLENYTEFVSQDIKLRSRCSVFLFALPKKFIKLYVTMEEINEIKNLEKKCFANADFYPSKLNEKSSRKTKLVLNDSSDDDIQFNLRSNVLPKVKKQGNWVIDEDSDDSVKTVPYDSENEAELKAAKVKKKPTRKDKKIDQKKRRIQDSDTLSSDSETDVASDNSYSDLKEDENEKISSKKTDNKMKLKTKKNELDKSLNENCKKGRNAQKNIENKNKSENSEINEDNEEGEAKESITKKKRKRVVLHDSDDSDGVEYVKPSRGRRKISKDYDIKSPKSKGRRNIKKIFTEKELKEETRLANLKEKERLERIAERQKLYNELMPTENDLTKPCETLVLEYDENSKKPRVQVDPDLVKCLKKHQIDGIKFMYNCTIESVQKLHSGEATGCILAHSMGLGKTLQVIAFLHTLFKNEDLNECIKHALIICPLNTVKNWYHEFLYWLNDKGLLDFPLFDLSEGKTILQRGEIMRLWKSRGGVMIVGINLFSNMISRKGRKPPKWVINLTDELFIDPGPDIVVVDEGHLLKNAQTATNKAVSSISTLRRIILTGTPLQNNLEEYHVMIQFVKPNLLGTKREFTNRFINPITNGQHIDSTDGDVKLMKKRVHVLHKLLDGCVQRFDYSVLMPYLQPKHEYVLSVRLSEKQIELYRYYLDKFARSSNSASLLADYNNFRLIWNHPGLLFINHTKRIRREINKELDDFVVSSSEEIELSSEEESDKHFSSGKSESGTDTEVCKKWTTRSRPIRLKKDKEGEEEEEEEEFPELKETDDFVDAWFRTLLNFEDRQKIELSGKLVLMFAMMDECEKIGDKIIVFTQSLDLLNLIEECLTVRAEEKREKTKDNDYTWIHGKDYFRIDGSVSSDSRKSHIDAFNNPMNLKARLFLLSTKAGGLGINLIGANRCIIFDCSWNPTHDIQAIFRIYRFGQLKPVYIYRFLAQGTMEEKIYDRQVIKQSLSIRVIDELSVGRHFKASDLLELYCFTPYEGTEKKIPNVPKDRLLADIMLSHGDLIISYHEHDSLLENRPDEDLTEEERKAAWQEYESEKDSQAQREKLEEELAKLREEQYRAWQHQQQQQQQQYQQHFAQQQARQQAFAASFLKTNEELLREQLRRHNEAKFRDMSSNPFSKVHENSRVPNNGPACGIPRGPPIFEHNRSKGLPPYDRLTLEDCLNYIGCNARSLRPEQAQEVIRILSNGATVVQKELGRLKDKKKISQLTFVELEMERKGIREWMNLQTQMKRAKDLITSASTHTNVFHTGGFPVTDDDEPIIESSHPRPVNVIIDEVD